MNRAQKCKLIGLVVSLILTGCTSAPDMPTPEKIGEKERLRVISGEQAAQVVNKMHGQSVAADENVIAEYGAGEKKDILYISRYPDPICHSRYRIESGTGPRGSDGSSTQPAVFIYCNL